MNEILIIIGKLIASSALLYAFYWLVLRNRASYTLARAYLLFIPFVSIIMSGLTLKVLPSNLSMETITNNAAPKSETTNAYTLVDNGKFKVLQKVNQKELDEISLEQNQKQAEGETATFWGEDTGRTFLLLLWGIIALVLVAIALYNIGCLYLMSRRMASQTTPEGFRLIRSPQVPAPCSFAKTVFMPTNLDDGKEDLILRHEKAHIRHAHFIDVWVMELMTRLLWFNPILWLTRNELRNVHEFEADHDVVAAGCDMGVYQTLLLAQVMDNGSYYANGFNHSFIRRRFVEMKRSTAGTLGRLGKIGVCLWVVALFCGFTLTERDAGAVKMAMPELSEPQMFVIEGEVGEDTHAEKNFNIYLADDYMHIDGKKPVATIPVVDGKFRYEIPLKKMTAGRLQSTRKGSPATDFFFVPGDTVHLYVFSDFNQLDPTYNYLRKAARSIIALRNATNWESPHLPEVKGKKWEEVTSLTIGYPQISVKEVIFGKNETVLRIVGDLYATDMNIRKDSYLTDGKGGKYNLRRALYGVVDKDNSTDVRVFGGYYAFAPVPEDVEELNFMAAIHTGPDSIAIKGPCIFHIKRAPKSEPQQPNFQMDITVSQGINDSGYLIELIGEPSGSIRPIADIPVIDRKCSFATHVDEPTMSHITATFPDGSICSAYVRFPFVPGEHATVKVMNGTFDLTGSAFYKQWSDADELEENAKKHHKPEETQALLLDYLKKHADEEGCVMRYWQYEVLSREEILKIIPDKIKNGRFKKFFEDNEHQISRVS